MYPTIQIGQLENGAGKSELDPDKVYIDAGQMTQLRAKTTLGLAPARHVQKRSSCSQVHGVEHLEETRGDGCNSSGRALPTRTDRRTWQEGDGRAVSERRTHTMT